MVPQSPSDAEQQESAPDATLYLRNREGARVDAVPFLVVFWMAFLVTFSFGPMYGMALGWSLDVSFAASAVVFAATGGGAYLQLVKRTRARFREEIPATQRLWRLGYAAIALVVVLAGLALPLL